MYLPKISCLILLSALGTRVFAAEPAMRLTIPRTSQAPTIDGKLAPGEWDDAAAVMGIINQFDGVAHPRQATFWLKFDDKNVYVAQRSSLLPGEMKQPPASPAPSGLFGLLFALNRAPGPDAMPPIYFKDNQNTVVVALSPNRVNSGDTPSHYRFMANVSTTQPVRRELCDQIKGLKFVSISSPYDSLDARHIPNSAKSANSINPDATVWESEYSIPLAEMNVEKTPVGEEWGILLARDYPQFDQNAIVQTESYRFDWVARDWRNLALVSAYHIEKDYARAKLVENAPIVQVASLGDLLAGSVRPSMTLINPTAQPTSVSIQISVGAQTQQEAIALAPHERKQWTAAEIKSPPEVRSELHLTVNDATGAALLQQVIPFRAAYAAERVAYVPDVWLSGEPKFCAGVIVPLSVYNPIRNTLCAKIQLAGRPELEKDRVRAEISVRRRGEEKSFLTMPMSTGVRGWGDYEAKTKLPADLKPGVYEITARLLGKDDKLLERSRDLFIRYDHEKELPWIGNKLGVTDKVLAPWTPIATKEAGGGGVTTSCWGRDYTTDGSGFPTRIDALGENILTGAAHFEATRDGQPVALTSAPRVENLKAAGHEVNYDGVVTGAGWKIATSAHLEYDGFVLYHVRLEPQGTQKLDRLRFVVPLANDVGRYLHASTGGNMREMVSTMALKPEEGPLWDSSQQRGNAPSSNGANLLVGNFKAYVWVGGVKRGLAFLADSDQGWVPDDTKKVNAIEVVRTKAGVELILNLVGRPFTFDHAREITFSLQATPIRPLPDDFRQRRIDFRMLSAFVGSDPDGWSWDGCQLALDNTWYLGGQGSAPFPLNWDRSAKWFAEGWKAKIPAANAIVAKYQAMNAHFHHPEVNDPRVPGLQGANWYGYLQPEITGHRDIYDAAISQTEVDYRIWRYARWLKETKLQGFYFDNSFAAVNANPDAGLGYVIDLPDRPDLNGKVQSGFAWLGMRDLAKRLRTLIIENGREPHIAFHCTDSFVIGAYAFGDDLLDGETLPMLTPTNPWFSEKWDPQYMQTLNDSSKWGLSISMLDMRDGFGPHHLEPIARANFRDTLGYMMLHDLDDAAYTGAAEWSGIDLKRKSDFLPYWNPAVAPALRVVDRANVFASAWRQDNALRVLVFNRNAQAQDAMTLVADPAALGLTRASGSLFVVKDLQADAPHDLANLVWSGNVKTGLSFKDDGAKITMTIDVPPHDFRVISIKPALP